MRWLGIDYGERRIGLAMSDECASFAFPYRTLPHNERTAPELQKIVLDQRVDGIVIGVPRNMDGSFGPAAAKAQTFGRKLTTILPTVKFIFWDERLTTVEAQRALHSAGKNTKKSKQMIDQVAAQILLQNFLDSLQWNSDS